MQGFVSLQKIIELCYPDSPLSYNALINGGRDKHVNNIRKPCAVLKVSIQAKTMNFLSNWEVITQ